MTPRFGCKKHPRKRPRMQGTSLDAYRIKPESLDGMILHHLGTKGPSTCEEIETALGRKHAAVSGNLRHLVEDQLVHATPLRRKTVSGRNAIVWRLGKDPRTPVYLVDPSGQVALFGERG